MKLLALLLLAGCSSNPPSLYTEVGALEFGGEEGTTASVGMWIPLGDPDPVVVERRVEVPAIPATFPVSKALPDDALAARVCDLEASLARVAAYAHGTAARLDDLEPPETQPAPVAGSASEPAPPAPRLPAEAPDPWQNPAVWGALVLGAITAIAERWGRGKYRAWKSTDEGT